MSTSTGISQPPVSPSPLPYHVIKSKLNDKAAGSISELSALCKLVLKGSGSQDLVVNTAKNFAAQDRTIETSSTALQKTFLLSSQLCSLSSEMEKQLLYLERFLQANDIKVDALSNDK